MSKNKKVQISEQKDKQVTIKSRPKKQKPTPEEMLKQIAEARVQLLKFETDLTADYSKIKSMNLKMINDTIEDALEGIKEDLEELQAEETKQKELLNKPQEPAK